MKEDWDEEINEIAESKAGYDRFTFADAIRDKVLIKEQNRIKAWLEVQHKAVQGKPNEHNYFLWAKKELFNE